MTSTQTITSILENSDRPHAATALENVERLAEIHEVEGLAPFVEGYCHYLATGKGQGALDSLRGTDKDLYTALRGKIIEASGVKRMSTRTSAVNDESLAAVAAFLA
jgi:hypothetical protein